MKASILGLLAETSIHPGAGQSTGFVDLPVAREAATDYPVLVGSSLKGALRQRAGTESMNDDSDGIDIDSIFGEQDCAGEVVVSDARLVLLPVRSLSGQFAWVTCPYLLERYSRDRTRAGLNGPDLEVSVAEGKALSNMSGPGPLFLEERQFDVDGAPDARVIKTLRELIKHGITANRLNEQLVILHNNDFAWFARYGLAINARNVLDAEKKTSTNLWYEETLPPDSLFYTLIADRKEGDSLARLTQIFASKFPYLQAGGNETVGQGWFAVNVVGNGGQQ